MGGLHQDRIKGPLENSQRCDWARNMLWSKLGLHLGLRSMAFHVNEKFTWNLILAKVYIINLVFTSVFLDHLVKGRCHRILGDHDALRLTTMDI